MNQIRQNSPIKEFNIEISSLYFSNCQNPKYSWKKSYPDNSSFKCTLERTLIWI